MQERAGIGLLMHRAEPHPFRMRTLERQKCATTPFGCKKETQDTVQVTDNLAAVLHLGIACAVLSLADVRTADSMLARSPEGASCGRLCRSLAVRPA